MNLFPVTVACGFNVCKQHLDELLENASNKQNKFKCASCHKEHLIPEDGLVINKQIQNALEIQFTTLKLSPVFDNCKKTMEETSASATKIESICKEPENYIYEYFEGIKRQVDL